MDVLSFKIIVCTGGPAPLDLPRAPHNRDPALYTKTSTKHSSIPMQLFLGRRPIFQIDWKITGGQGQLGEVEESHSMDETLRHSHERG